LRIGHSLSTGRDGSPSKQKNRLTKLQLLLRPPLPQWSLSAKRALEHTTPVPTLARLLSKMLPHGPCRSGPSESRSLNRPHQPRQLTCYPYSAMLILSPLLGPANHGLTFYYISTRILLGLILALLTHLTLVPYPR
jgi:hypothetical protein